MKVFVGVVEVCVVGLEDVEFYILFSSGMDYVVEDYVEVDCEIDVGFVDGYDGWVCVGSVFVLD